MAPQILKRLKIQFSPHGDLNGPRGDFFAKFIILMNSGDQITPILMYHIVIEKFRFFSKIHNLASHKNIKVTPRIFEDF